MIIMLNLAETATLSLVLCNVRKQALQTETSSYIKSGNPYFSVLQGRIYQFPQTLKNKYINSEKRWGKLVSQRSKHFWEVIEV